MRRYSDKTCLLIGMANSPHFHSWVLAMIETGSFKRIIIFPSDIPRKWSEFRRIAKHQSCTRVLFFRLFPLDFPNYLMMHAVNLGFGTNWRSWCISKILLVFKPRILHYHELQHSGYALLPLHRKFRKRRNHYPKIIGSTWGSDLKYFAYTDAHKSKIRQLLNFTDVITSERTDEKKELALFNFKGPVIAPVYISVGFDSKEIQSQWSPPSSRNLILVRGYQHDQGRALNALKALELSASELTGFRVRVFSSHKSPSVNYQTQIMRNTLGIDIDVLPQMDHEKFLNVYSDARIYIGLSETDGLSTSMVEAMKFGAFPIQSQNSAAGEFLENSKTGFIVDPWDIDSIRHAIHTALSDGELIDSAAEKNRDKILSAYSRSVGLQRMKELYAKEN